MISADAIILQKYVFLCTTTGYFCSTKLLPDNFSRKYTQYKFIRW